MQNNRANRAAEQQRASQQSCRQRQGKQTAEASLQLCKALRQGAKVQYRVVYLFIPQFLSLFIFSVITACQFYG